MSPPDEPVSVLFASSSRAAAQIGHVRRFAAGPKNAARVNLGEAVGRIELNRRGRRRGENDDRVGLLVLLVDVES